MTMTLAHQSRVGDWAIEKPEGAGPGARKRFGRPRRRMRRHGQRGVRRIEGLPN
jgi:hypothetical protein